MGKLPISCIIVFGNERAMLAECLPRLARLGELILIDMQSTDGSRHIAEQYADVLLQCEQAPIADAVRVEAQRYATHPWIMMADPDEHYPPSLIEAIGNTIAAKPDAGGIRVPLWFNFKRKSLRGTIWGGGNKTKLALVRRGRGRLLGMCNLISEVFAGFETVRLDPAHCGYMAHEWSQSYLDLLNKHVIRYPYRDAMRMHKQGRRFRLSEVLIAPIRELNRCLRHHDGWREGFRGLALSAIYATYHAVTQICLGLVQWRAGRAAHGAVEEKAPALSLVTQRDIVAAIAPKTMTHSARRAA